MRKTICKIIVCVFIDCFLCIMLTLFMLNNQDVTMCLLTSVGLLCIGGSVVSFVDWLFKDNKNK